MCAFSYVRSEKGGVGRCFSFCGGLHVLFMRKTKRMAHPRIGKGDSMPVGRCQSGMHRDRDRQLQKVCQNASASSEDRTRRRYGAPRGSSGISRGSSGSCILSAYRSAAYHATARLDRFRHQLYLFKKLWRSTTVYCGAATWQWIFRLLLPRSAQNRWRPGCHEGGEALGPVEESTVACSR